MGGAGGGGGSFLFRQEETAFETRGGSDSETHITLRQCP
jgi:hypothetical protein